MRRFRFFYQEFQLWYQIDEEGDLGFVVGILVKLEKNKDSVKGYDHGSQPTSRLHHYIRINP